MVGLLQGFFVRWVVGLNLLSISEKRYGFNAPMDAIISTFEDNDSYLIRKIEEVDEEIDGVRVFKAEIPTGEAVVLAMREDLTQSNSTILATVAYETGSTSMRDTKRASDTRDAIVLQILGSLTQTNYGTSMTVLGKDENDVATKQAYLKATEPSLSKTEIASVFFKELPRYFQYAIASTVALLFVITILSGFDLAKFDFVDAVIILFVALVAELGVSIRQERVRKKRPKNRAKS